MSSFVRLSVFLLVSIVLHLLALQLEVSRQADVPHQQVSQGVSLVARSSKQFLEQAMPKVVPEKREHTRQKQLVEPVVTKAEKLPPEPIVEPDKKVVKKKDNPRKAPIPLAVKPVFEALEEVKAAIEEPVDLEEAIPSKVVTVETEPEQDNDYIAPAETEELVSSGFAQLSVSPTVTNVGVAKKTFKEASPRYDLNPEPDYPEVARRRGQEGSVKLDVLVLANGEVGEVKLRQSSGYRKLDNAAIRAVRFWLFRPAMSISGPIESRVIVPVDFVLGR